MPRHAGCRLGEREWSYRTWLVPRLLAHRMPWHVRRYIDPDQPAGQRAGLRLMMYAMMSRISVMVSCVFGIGGCGTMIRPARRSGVVSTRPAMAANVGISGLAVEAEPGDTM